MFITALIDDYMYEKGTANLCKTATFKKTKMVFKTNYSLMQVCNTTIRPLSYHLSLRSLFCLFLSGRFTEVILYAFDERRSYLDSYSASTVIDNCI